MYKSPVVSDELAQKFASEKDTPYERWVRSQGLDIKPAMYVRQLRTIALKPWAERGGMAEAYAKELETLPPLCEAAE
jgi:hypothetical protein